MKLKTLAEIAQISTGHTFKGKAETLNNKTGNTVIQIKDVVEGLFDNNKNLPLANEEHGVSLSKLKESDLLIPMRGNRKTVMQINKLDSEQNIIASSQLAMITVEHQLVLPRYLLWYFNSDVGKAKLHSLSVGSTIPQINIKSLKKLEVEIPDLLTQSTICDIYTNWLEQKKNLRMLLKNGTELTNEACLSLIQEN